MKNNKIKLLVSSILLTLMFGLASCVDDLNVTPIDPSSVQEFQQEGCFVKCYACFAITGQEGPAGTPDIINMDEGSEAPFIRGIFNLNDVTTDECICAWKNDAGIPDFNYNVFRSSNVKINGLYQRLLFNVMQCNYFISQTKDKTDETTLKEVAEVRFLRTLNYYYLMDLFGNVPFSLEEVNSNTTLPKQIKRADLYAWIVGELRAIEPSMYEPKQAPYYRVDKVANWLLLSRVYLNASVYTGTAKLDSAAYFAYKVIKSDYKLATKYKYLFMADNNGSSVNDAPNEIIFPIEVDGKLIKNYGHTQFLIASTHYSDMPDWGLTAQWGGNRARSALVGKFFSDISSIPTSDNLTTAAQDDRAMFYSKKRTVTNDDYTEFKNGLSVIKYSNLRADGSAASDKDWTDTDFPLMRKAEAYLNYAEAVFRGASPIDAYTPLQAINELRNRANAKPLTTLNESNLLDEWSREFYFEGRRRTDLIRFDSYGGSNSYTWEWKGGSAAGRSFSANYNLFPIPDVDLNANPNLVQNKGY